MASLTAKETLKHKQAFEYYYGTGEQRSLKQVAEYSGVAHVTAKKWSVNFAWADRIIVRDRTNAKTLAKKTDNQIVKDKENYIKVIKGMFGKAVQDFKANKIGVENVGDMERLIRLHLLLAGESTEINTIKIEVVEKIIQQVVVTVEKYVDDPRAISGIAREIKGWGGDILDAESS